jgi:hypothetical protein
MEPRRALDARPSIHAPDAATPLGPTWVALRRSLSTTNAPGWPGRWSMCSEAPRSVADRPGVGKRPLCSWDCAPCGEGGVQRQERPGGSDSRVGGRFGRRQSEQRGGGPRACGPTPCCSGWLSSIRPSIRASVPSIFLAPSRGPRWRARRRDGGELAAGLRVCPPFRVSGQMLTGGAG